MTKEDEKNKRQQAVDAGDVNSVDQVEMNQTENITSELGWGFKLKIRRLKYSVDKGPRRQRSA